MDLIIQLGGNLDKKTVLGIAVILLILASWAVGNLLYTLPHIYGGGEDEYPEFNQGSAGTGEVEGADAKLIKYIYYFFIGALIVLSILAVAVAVIEKDKTMVVKLIATAIGTGLAMLIFVLIFSPGQMKIGDAIEPPSGDGGTGGSPIPLIGGSIGGVILLLVGVGLLGVIVYYRVNSYLYDKMELGEEEDIRDEISSTVEKTVDELYKGKDVRSTVIRCYQSMCRVLEDTGVEQDDFMTPREFEVTAVRRLDVSKGTLETLTSMFEEARYSRHELGDTHRKKAMTSLNALRDELGGGAHGTD